VWRHNLISCVLENYSFQGSFSLVAILKICIDQLMIINPVFLNLRWLDILENNAETIRNQYLLCIVKKLDLFPILMLINVVYIIQSMIKHVLSSLQCMVSDCMLYNVCMHVFLYKHVHAYLLVFLNVHANIHAHVCSYY